MQWLKNKSECCGCGACAQSCLQNCIAMKEDEEGFWYPVIDQENCIRCGLCERACPAIHQCEREYEEKVYAAASNDRELVSRSSSGGMFGILAEYILSKNGVIFGAAFNDEMELVHSSAENQEGCRKFHGSKYIQSNTENTFAECKKYLAAGRYVLYTGTPCQIAGLKRYLQKDFENLLTVELICHGVPSPGIWRRYVRELEEVKGHRIMDAAFRYQDSGWKVFRFMTEYDNGEVQVIPGVQSPYFTAFLNNLTLRPSCYECKYRLAYSKSDLMIGDFWGVGKYHQNFDEQLGVSALLVMSDKGEQVFSEIQDQMHYVKSDISMLTPMNGCIRLSVFPNKNRQAMMEAYAGKENLSEALRRYAINYDWGEHKFALGVWGSYNSRLVSQFLITGSQQRRTFHYSNSSVISVMSDETELPDEPVMENPYRKEALTADWEKRFRKQFERIVEQTDYILIDLLEERFDLLRYGNTYITESDALKESILTFNRDVIGQEELLKSGVWSEKLLQFIKLLESKFIDRQIILLELYLNEVYFDGREYIEFADAEKIRQMNAKLKEIYELFLQYCPKACHITLNKELHYSAYTHRYGCIPSHLNYEACFALADQIYNIMVGKNEQIC